MWAGWGRPAGGKARVQPWAWVPLPGVPGLAVRWLSLHWGFLSRPSLWLQKCQVKRWVTEGGGSGRIPGVVPWPSSGRQAGGWVSLPSGQPPVSGLSPQASGRGLEHGLPLWGLPASGDPCSFTGGHGHSEVCGLTPTAQGPRGATKELLFLCKQWQLGHLGPPPLVG